MKRDKFATVLDRKIYIADSFIKPAVCRKILAELQDAHWHSSMVIQHGSPANHTAIREDFRSSRSLRQEWFSDRLQELVIQVEKDLAEHFGCDPRRLELWQATRYEGGERFSYHLDAGSWRRSKAGERVRTYLVYLDTPKKGGETHFRALDVRVRPKAGRLAAWNNVLPSGHCDYAMVHAGLDVIAGVKTTLVTWERQRSFRKEGKSK
jgi:prolyl 4-hydroxylase